MQFLCLHGAIGNINNISIQLAPLRKELGTDNAASFYYINAPMKMTPPPGFEEYFGIGPHYRWADDGGAAEDSMISRVRKIPDGQNPEDVMRELVGDRDVVWKNHKEIMQYLYDTLDKNPDIEGIIGYSEGASIAATLILDEEKRKRETGRPRRIKCGMFVTGWPPIDSTKGIILADETEVIIDVPSLHVVGAHDPFRQGAYALYNVCDPNTATFFDTGKGHTIPRSGLVIHELGDAVRDLIAKAYSPEDY
ncbi:uncharacterized protein N7459_006834 [Penicillium hispanicum]|uniref:uncharacterized protein n=1 Tax=Penicillium hispanicum TaxID=1080232 RepID=UPI0025407AB5|nr:uncharacterized protein N7459_006834 [Penicillium hispanicum]KAJ5577870.1 hypothetical protein N7459_006834 [Penicillium hispanicum]